MAVINNTYLNQYLPKMIDWKIENFCY